MSTDTDAPDVTDRDDKPDIRAHAKDLIRRELASRHHVAVGDDDPILMLHTLNELLIQHTAAAQQQSLEEYRQQMEISALDWAENCRIYTQRAFEQALPAMQEILNNSAREIAKETTQLVGQELQLATTALEKLAKDARRAANMVLVAAVLVMVAAVIVVF